MSGRALLRLGASIRLGSLLGIPIRLHFTFLIVVAWLTWLAARNGGDAVFWLILLLLLFGCVVLHELGHAVMAMLFGVKTREIILLPIGGLARLERMPLGVAELLIALAGPAVNLALALVLAIVGLLMGLPQPGIETELPDLRSLVWVLMFSNLSLMAFNLLPAFPMDGGRVLRGVLSFFLPMELATHWATRIGQALAVFLVVIGIALPNPFLIFIAILVFFGAAQELYFQRSRTEVSGRVASEAMITRYETVAPQDSLESVAQLMLESYQEVYPVIDGWQRLAGVVNRAILHRALAERQNGAAVLDVMVREYPSVSPDTPLEEVLEKLQNPERFPVFVLEEGRLVGMVTAENLGEMMQLGRLMRSRSESG